MPEKNCRERTHRELIESHQQHLRDFIFMICPNRTYIDDILQETNRVLWEKRMDFQPGTNFLAWARKIAKYQTMSFQTTSQRSAWLRFDSELVHTLAEIIEAQKGNPSSRIKALNRCVSRLSEADQALIQMRYESQLSLSQISDATSRSEGALKQVFLRIRGQLKQCIERTVLVETRDLP